MKLDDAFAILNNPHSQPDEIARAGKRLHTYLKGAITQTERMSAGTLVSLTSLENPALAKSHQNQMLAELDTYSDKVAEFRLLFPEIDGWDEIETRIITLHDKWRRIQK